MPVEIKPNHSILVTQDELDELIGLENQIRRLRARYRRAAAMILNRLTNGASVEPGTHSAFIERVEKGDHVIIQLRVH